MTVAAPRNGRSFDWGLKLLAFAIALLLWAAYHSEPTVEMTFEAPLEFRNIPSNLEISGDYPATVRVQVRGRSAVLRQITAGSLAVMVDLRDAAPGASRLRLGPSLIDPPLGAEVVRLSPAEIRLRLDPRGPTP